MNETEESLGRIEIAPAVLVAIAHFAAERTEGILKMAAIPPDMARLFRRAVKQDGVLLNLTDNQINFDIYVYMDPTANLMETSRRLQAAVVEAVDTMIGMPVKSVNVHVEDVVYAIDDAI